MTFEDISEESYDNNSVKAVNNLEKFSFSISPNAKPEDNNLSC